MIISLNMFAISFFFSFYQKIFCHSQLIDYSLPFSLDEKQTHFEIHDLICTCKVIEYLQTLKQFFLTHISLIDTTLKRLDNLQMDTTLNNH